MGTSRIRAWYTVPKEVDLEAQEKTAAKTMGAFHGSFSSIKAPRDFEIVLQGPFKKDHAFDSFWNPGLFKGF